jgi:hypothetical protein
MLATIAASISLLGGACHAVPSGNSLGEVVYTYVVALSKEEPEYYLNYDLFMRQLPDGEATRLTDWASSQFLGKGLGPPSWSPNGNNMLFQGLVKNSKPVMPQNVRPSQPWILDVRTKKLRLIGQGKDRWYMDTAWLRDGKGIMARVAIGKRPEFFSYGGLEVEFVMSGARTVLLTINLATGREKMLAPRFSGSLFVGAARNGIVTYRYKTDGFDLVNVKTGRWRRLCRAGLVEASAISPDGLKLAFYCDSAVRVCDLRTRKTRTLYKGPYKHMHASRLVWSPDGRRLALEHYIMDVGNGDPPPPAPDIDSYILVFDVTTGRMRLSQDGNHRSLVDWTRDGRRLVIKEELKSDKPSAFGIKTILSFLSVAGAPPIAPVEIDSRVNYIDLR